jgi:putative hydrolases of HD superfamily
MSEGKDLSADIDFLFEMGNIRYIDRMWRRFYNKDFANLAEHHFRVFWIAMVIASHEKNVDTGKIAKMVLVHDIAESRTGDVDYLARQYVERNEKLGIEDMLRGTAVEEEFYQLWHEYEDRKTIESKIVKDADNLDVDFELQEQYEQGYKIIERWQDMRDRVVSKKLYTKTARIIGEQIKNTSPHNWHEKGRNRFNSGDWQNKLAGKQPENKKTPKSPPQPYFEILLQPYNDEN